MRAAKKQRDKELKRRLSAERDDIEEIERQIAQASAKKKAKLEELAALYNSYQVIMIQCAVLLI